MAKYILEGAGNINWMAIFSLLTFMTIFTVSALMAFRKDNPIIRKMENLPLEDEG